MFRQKTLCSQTLSTALYDDVILNKTRDYLFFTSKDVAYSCKISLSLSSIMLLIFTDLNIVGRVSKVENQYIYCISCKGKFFNNSFYKT